MKVEVRTPDQFFGDVLGDINSRRGQVQDVETFGTLSDYPRHATPGRDVWLHDGAAVQ
jgi:elongation factor G